MTGQQRDDVHVGTPTGTLTFLFTDVVGSTDLWARHPGPMSRALARHDALARHAIEAAGGRVFSTAGDAFHAVFDRTDAAVAAALALHRAVAAEPWEAEAVIAVRAALHTGEALERDGDYFGSTLNRVARLVGLAAGGQTVCSAATARVLTDRPVLGATPRPLGAARLKGLPGTEDVHGLVVAGSPDTFEPIAPEQAQPAGNLAGAVDPLVGRGAELAAVGDAVGRARLVTLTGTGGVGKTSLARSAAHAVAPQFTGGAWWIDLAEVGPEADLAATLAGELRIRQQPDIGALASVTTALAGDRLLLVLDNCEHVLAPAAALARAIVTRCPGVVVLATSRRRLGLPDEEEIVVRPLRCDGPQPDAVALLVRRVGPGASRWPAAEHDALHELARRLDGLPLALELAARRCRALHPSDVLARLTDRFRALGGDGGRETLRGTVRWSFDLLGPVAQQVLAPLSVITGAFSIGAAEAVGVSPGIDAFDVDDAVVELVECGLLDGADGRYQMLETTREFALALLTKAEREASLDRQCRWVLDLVHAAQAGLRGPDELAWVARLDADWSSVRAAYQRLSAQGDVGAVERIVLALYHEGWFRRPEALRWIAEAYERFGGPGGGASSSLTGAAAFSAWLVGGADARSVRELGERALAEGEARQDRSEYDDGLAESAILLGHLYGGRPLDALAIIELRARRCPDDYAHVFSITSRCSAHALAARPSDGRPALEEATEVAGRLGNPTATAWVKLNACYTLEDPALAAAAALEAVEWAQRARNRFVELTARQSWAADAGALGAPDHELIAALVDIAREEIRAGWHFHAWAVVANLARILARAGSFEAALLAGEAVARSPWGPATRWLARSIGTWSAALDPVDVGRIRARAERLDAAGVLAAVAGGA